MIHYDESIKKPIYSNKEFLDLKGYLDEKIAKVTLGKFLYSNIGLTVRLLTGIQLFPYQEIILRSWFDHNFCMNVVARGGSKTTLCAIFSAIYPIFHPNTRIVLTGNSFRNTRKIIKNIEQIINAPKAALLKQCYSQKTGKLEFTKRQDEMVMDINGGSIVALPLSSGTRGVRADVLFCDEFLQIPEELYEFVLKPFLTAKNNIQEQLAIREMEDILIAQGKMTEEERTILPSNKKIIALTSASYDFEFAFKLYSQWVEKILNPSMIDKDETGEETKEKRTYFALRLSYKSLPAELVEKEVIEEAKSGGEDSASFQREYMAIFSSSSDGFFNIKKLHENTIKNGDLPCVQLKGNPNSEYILSCDPNFSSSSASDFFAFGVYLLNNEERTLTLVHSYGVAGGKLQDHIAYLYYIITNFNIVFFTADLSGDGEGFNFVQACNESSIFMDKNLKLSFIQGDFNKEEYQDELIKFKNSHNLSNRTICYRQKYSADWIRKANEYLQTQIDKGKVKFASKLASHDTMMERALEQNYTLNSKSVCENDLLDWIGEEDNAIDQVKRQLALIEPKLTDGTIKFDLPQHLKRSKSPDRARRDNYSCLVMGAWAAKCYWDMLFAEGKKEDEVFIPRFL